MLLIYFYLASCYIHHQRLAKMNKILTTAITIAALLPMCTTAQADAHSAETTASNIYVGIDVGKGKHNIKFNSANTAAAHDDSVTTMSFFVGMDLNETFAIEGFYSNLGESKITGTTTKIKATTMGVAFKAGTDLTEDIRGFVKAGYHSWKTKATAENDGTDLLYGVGVEYKLSDTTAILAGYDRFTANDSNLVTMTIGIKYGF